MIASSPPAIVVCDGCAVRRLDAALRTARTGATIVVHGEQDGNFIVRTPVTIRGTGDAVLDGRGRGTVLAIRAANVRVSDIAIRGSGADFVGMDSGVYSNGARTTLKNLRISDTLFGVYLAHADDSVVEDSHITGRRAVAVPQRGDGLRIWYSKNVRLEGNTIEDARDDLIWFSEGARVIGNDISGGRYGVHTMYSDDMVVASNVVRDCEVGSYAMYGHHLDVERNIFAGNRGSTGYGIGLKSIDYATIESNAFVSNHTGIYLDNAPSLEGSTDRFSDNLLAYNEFGIASLPSSHGDVMVGNTFLQNYRQVTVLGGGTLTHMTWTQAGRGNYWSDYAGYDRDGNGVGDIPYEPRSAYGMLADLNDRLNLLVYSPAAKAVDFAANALPFFQEPAALVDRAPAMQPMYPRGIPQLAQARSQGSYASIGVIAIALSFGVLIPLRPRLRKRKVVNTGDAIIVRNLTKRYGKTLALNHINLEIPPGETVALWGPNGSGKTTFMRCLLGLVEYEGEITGADGFGYVPQQLPAFDMRVGELAILIGGLRSAQKHDCLQALRSAGLFDLRDRNVLELSGGQRQRLALALAGLGNPDVLLLDEPTVGLDLESRHAILQSLSAAKALGKTIVIASHIPEDVTAVADRIAVLQDGHIDSILTAPEFESMIERYRKAAS